MGKDKELENLLGKVRKVAQKEPPPCPAEQMVGERVTKLLKEFDNREHAKTR